MELIRHKYSTPNVGKVERGASVMAGSLLAYYGVKAKSWSGAALALLGVAFLRRGITGFCYSYQSLGINTAPDEQGKNSSIPYELGIRVDEAITINRPRSEVYAFWRNLENLAEFMEHVESVRVTEGNRSHWVVKAPAGTTVEWDAELISDGPERIEWRSLPGADVENAGSVEFKRATAGHGTIVKASIQYKPPAGQVGAAVAKLFAREPGMQARSDLRRFKAVVETGEVPTIVGQSSGRVLSTT